MLVPSALRAGGTETTAEADVEPDLAGAAGAGLYGSTTALGMTFIVGGVTTPYGD